METLHELYIQRDKIWGGFNIILNKNLAHTLDNDFNSVNWIRNNIVKTESHRGAEISLPKVTEIEVPTTEQQNAVRFEIWKMREQKDGSHRENVELWGQWDEGGKIANESDLGWTRDGPMGQLGPDSFVLISSIFTL